MCARCSMLCDEIRKNGEETRHRKKWTSEACIILAGTDASSGHSVMKKA